MKQDLHEPVRLKAEQVFEDSPSLMSVDRVHWFLALFDELGVEVWLDGGWGVDALLGKCTRNHGDLDIMISWPDSVPLIEALFAHGFVHIYTDDRKERNFVMGHRAHGLIDFHVIERTEGGGGVYGPGEIDWVIDASELNAVGFIEGRKVRCLSVDYQVRSHTGYTLKDTDFADLQALQERYGVALLPEQIQDSATTKQENDDEGGGTHAKSTPIPCHRCREFATLTGGREGIAK